MQVKSHIIYNSSRLSINALLTKTALDLNVNFIAEQALNLHLP